MLLPRGNRTVRVHAQPCHTLSGLTFLSSLFTVSIDSDEDDPWLDPEIAEEENERRVEEEEKQKFVSFTANSDDSDTDTDDDGEDDQYSDTSDTGLESAPVTNLKTASTDAASAAIALLYACWVFTDVDTY